MTARYDLTIKQGSDFDLPMTFRSGGALMPLTGYQFKMQIRDFSDEVVWEGTDSNGGIIVNSTNSTVRIRIPNSTTELFVFEGAKYDLEMQSPDLKISRLMEGSVKLSRQVTR